LLEEVESLSERIREYDERIAQALFLEVMAEKADQPCSTFLLPQCEQMIFSFSCSATVKIFENVFLQAWQKNS
jgi:hypothetical protein